MSIIFENEIISESISKMYLDADTSDLKFTFGSDDETLIVSAHKAVLASASTVFYTKFYGPSKGDENINITGASAEAFKQFLQLFYLSEVTITMENVADAIRLAHKYDMLEHLNMCIAHLETKLTDDNMFWAYQLAIEVNHQHLKQFCEDELTFSMAEILDSDEFLCCDREVLKHILQIDRMFVDEIVVFNACVAWAKSFCRRNGLAEESAKNLREQIGDCFRLIRFGTMTKTNIHELTSNEQYTGLFEPDELDDIMRMSTEENHKSSIFNNSSRVRMFLTKMIAGSVDSMYEHFQSLKIDSEEKMASLISVLFERAINQPKFSSTCAQLCLKLIKSIRECEFRCTEKKEPFGTVFKKELLNKCQAAFNKLADENQIREKLSPIQCELNETIDNDRKLALRAILEAEVQKLRRHSVGMARFVGELYRKQILHTNIIEFCVVKLLKIGTEEKLECLCELLTTVGEQRELNDVFTYDDILAQMIDRSFSRDLKSHFETIQQIVSNKDQLNKISGRVRFMLMDLIELRKNRWVRRRTDAFAESLQRLREIREERYRKEFPNLEYYEASFSDMDDDVEIRKDIQLNHRIQRNYRIQRGRMLRSGHNNRWNRGASRWFDRDDNYSRSSFYKSKFRTNSSFEQNLEDTPMQSQFIRMPNQKTQPQLIEEILENLSTGVQMDAPQIDSIDREHRWTFVRDLFKKAIETSDLNEAKRCFIGTICTYWLVQQQITKQDYVRGLTEYVETLADVVIDSPKIYEWTAQMISVAFFSGVVSLNDLKNMSVLSRGGILAVLLPYMAYEYGPHYVRNVWTQSGCNWNQFDANVNQFLERNKLRFVENLQEKLPPASKQLPEGRLKSRIRHLIWDEKVLETEVVEYVNLHVPTINKQSVRSLTKVLIEVALLHNKIQEKQLIRSINVLNEYIGGELKKDLQLESLYAIQLLSNELEHPSGFLYAVFNELHDNEVIAAEVFKNWEKSVDEPLGKGIAVKNLTHFLKYVDDEAKSYEKA